jgi:hypothetical protein
LVRITESLSPFNLNCHNSELDENQTVARCPFLRENGQQVNYFSLFSVKHFPFLTSVCRTQSQLFVKSQSTPLSHKKKTTFTQSETAKINCSRFEVSRAFVRSTHHSFDSFLCLSIIDGTFPLFVLIYWFSDIFIFENPTRSKSLQIACGQVFIELLWRNETEIVRIICVNSPNPFQIRWSSDSQIVPQKKRFTENFKSKLSAWNTDRYPIGRWCIENSLFQSSEISLNGKVRIARNCEKLWRNRKVYTLACIFGWDSHLERFQNIWKFRNPYSM